MINGAGNSVCIFIGSPLRHARGESSEHLVLIETYDVKILARDSDLSSIVTANVVDLPINIRSGGTAKKFPTGPIKFATGFCCKTVDDMSCTVSLCNLTDLIRSNPYTTRAILRNFTCCRSKFPWVTARGVAAKRTVTLASSSMDH